MFCCIRTFSLWSPVFRDNGGDWPKCSSVCDCSPSISHWVPEGEEQCRKQLLTDQKPLNLREPAQYVLAQPSVLCSRTWRKGDGEGEKPDESVCFQRRAILFWIQSEFLLNGHKASLLLHIYNSFNFWKVWLMYVNFGLDLSSLLRNMGHILIFHKTLIFPWLKPDFLMWKNVCFFPPKNQDNLHNVSAI